MAVQYADGVDPDGAAAETGMSPDLFEILVCPVDKHDLILAGSTLRCPVCDRRYPIHAGIPNMLVDDER